VAFAAAGTTAVAPVGVLDPRMPDGVWLEVFGVAGPLQADRSAIPAVVPASFNIERRLMEWLLVTRYLTAITRSYYGHP
jgi:hypothetical protein